MPLLHFISTLLSKVQGVGVISFILTGRENLKEHRVGSLQAVKCTQTCIGMNTLKGQDTIEEPMGLE